MGAVSCKGWMEWDEGEYFIVGLEKFGRWGAGVVGPCGAINGMMDVCVEAEEPSRVRVEEAAGESSVDSLLNPEGEGEGFEGKAGKGIRGGGGMKGPPEGAMPGFGAFGIDLN